MAYEHLYSNEPIERTLEYKGKTEQVYFKRLNAGERFQLKAGQKGSVKAGESSFEVDLGDMEARNQKFLHFANVKANGQRVFKTPQEVAALPGDLFDALLKLATDALAEGGDEGNG